MINYARLGRSTDYYSNHGFTRIEVPWTVTSAVSALTKPIDVEDFTIAEKNKVLIGSAEQGFLYLYLKGFLPLGRFQAITPCFRNDKFDLTHTKYFIKNELIITDTVNDESLKDVIAICIEFFEQELSTHYNV